MMTFQYRARTPTGSFQEGVLTAASEAEAVRMLQKQSLFPLRVQSRRRETSAAGSSLLELAFLRKMRTYTKPAIVALFTRQMASMIASGLSLVRALRSAARDQSSKKFSLMVEEIAQHVEQGLSLSQAMRAYPGTFDRIYVSALLDRHRNNVTKAAAAAGLSRKHLHDLVKKLDLGTD